MVSSVLVILDLGLFSNHVEHGVLQSFFVLAKSVLLPSEIHNPAIKVVAIEAVLEEVDAGSVVRVLLELKGAAVFHELLEL